MVGTRFLCLNSHLHGRVSLAVTDLRIDYHTLVALWKGKSMVKPSVKTRSLDEDEKQCENII